MSMDNGIYILQLKDECRVLHTKNIENVLSDGKMPFQAEWLVEYFRDAPAYPDAGKAAVAAAELMQGAGEVEHGIQFLCDLSRTWVDYVKVAERQA